MCTQNALQRAPSRGTHSEPDGGTESCRRNETSSLKRVSRITVSDSETRTWYAPATPSPGPANPEHRSHQREVLAEGAARKRLAWERAQRERLAQDQAERQKLARQRAEREAAACIRAARLRAEREWAARERAERDRAAWERAQRERAERLKAVQEKVADGWARELTDRHRDALAAIRLEFGAAGQPSQAGDPQPQDTKTASLQQQQHGQQIQEHQKLEQQHKRPQQPVEQLYELEWQQTLHERLQRTRRIRDQLDRERARRQGAAYGWSPSQHVHSERAALEQAAQKVREQHEQLRRQQAQQVPAALAQPQPAAVAPAAVAPAASPKRVAVLVQQPPPLPGKRSTAVQLSAAAASSVAYQSVIDEREGSVGTVILSFPGGSKARRAAKKRAGQQARPQPSQPRQQQRQAQQLRQSVPVRLEERTHGACCTIM